jgi:putative ABC transport system substrate-binding protein
MQFNRLTRCEFITLIGGAVLWPLAARAQQSVSKMPRIGIIDPVAIWDHFRQGLRDLGYIEGKDIAIEYRSVEERPEQLVAAATELAQLPVDVIVTWGSPATQAAKQATKTIPIVMIGIGDPIKAGFVASLAHPAGNITGNALLGTELAAKRLQLLKLAVPTMRRVAVLWNPDNASVAAYPDEWKAAARVLGVALLRHLP